MQMNISGHHVELTPAIRAYVTEKLQRLSKHFDHLIAIDCILKVEKLEHVAEATVKAAGRTLFADASAPDMYAAIDLLSDKRDRQVRKYKNRLRDNHHGRQENAASNF